MNDITYKKNSKWLALIVLVTLIALSTHVNAADMGSVPGVVTISSGWLNVRNSPSTSAPKVSALEKGSHVTLISRSGDWWKVEYAKGQYGYCHSSYITVVQGYGAKVATQSGSLNVRAGAGTGYQRVASLYKGEVVVVLSSSNGWSKILYHGNKLGYVSASYLSGYYGKVSVNVPSLKQMDTRWANQIVGQSGKTFAQIGCATTAIAMIESLRRGYTIFPNVISEELRYTPSGSVYWPADYTPVTSNEQYLQRIYDQLKKGKAVLFGSRNVYGSQHWVVVTGFSGGEKLNAAGFTIQDPGTNYRTNLQEFLDVYPNFYKYFLY